MVMAGMALRLETPLQLDKDGVECNKKDVFGSKAPHVITHPRYCLVTNKVGRNTNQKGDGHKGGQKILVESGTTANNQCSTKDNHFTDMGVTALTRELVMRVLILRGTREDTSVEAGINTFSEQVGEKMDADFI